MNSYRNKFEQQVAAQLGPQWEYEPMKLHYRIDFTYTPDFVDHSTKTIIESKGFMDAATRRGMIAVKQQNPDYTIVFCFQNPALKISKGSKTTYKEWAIKNGFGVMEAQSGNG